MLKIKLNPEERKIRAKGNPIVIGGELVEVNIEILENLPKEFRKSVAFALADTIKNHFEDEKEGK